MQSTCIATSRCATLAGQMMLVLSDLRPLTLELDGNLLQRTAASLEKQLAQALTDVEFAKERSTGEVKSVGREQSDSAEEVDGETGSAPVPSAAVSSGGSTSSTSAEPPETLPGQLTTRAADSSSGIAAQTDGAGHAGVPDSAGQVQGLAANEAGGNAARSTDQIRSMTPAESGARNPTDKDRPQRPASDAEAGADSVAGSDEPAAPTLEQLQRQAAAKASLQQQRQRQQDHRAVLHRRDARSAGSGAVDGSFTSTGKVYLDEEGREFHLDDPHVDDADRRYDGKVCSISSRAV